MRDFFWQFQFLCNVNRWKWNVKIENAAITKVLIKISILLFKDTNWVSVCSQFLFLFLPRVESGDFYHPIEPSARIKILVLFIVFVLCIVPVKKIDRVFFCPKFASLPFFPTFILLKTSFLDKNEKKIAFYHVMLCNIELIFLLLKYPNEGLIG